MKILVALIFSIAIFRTCESQTMEERLENIKSNHTFIQQWKEHIKLWQQEHTYGGEINCEIDKSRRRPRSVHELRPQDIGIVGAMGSSIMAGMGAGADSLSSLLLEYRGLSFAIGGDGELSNMVTIPNILKQFNSEIFGQSQRIAPVWYERFSQLNVAKSGARSIDLRNQADELIRRIEEIPGHERMWKLISINIGTNDICQFCNEKRSYPDKWIKEFRKVFDTLQKRLPRTFVNLIPLKSLDQWRSFQTQYPVCEFFLRFECPCLDHMQALMHQKKFNYMLKRLAEEYNGHEFTVEVQPFWEGSSNTSKSKNAETTSDLSYMAPDCFHLSQLGHASAAHALWNNMVEYEEKKDTVWDPANTRISCPDITCPYLRTRRNSIHCVKPRNETSEETTEVLWPEESSKENNSTDTWLHRRSTTEGESSEEEEDEEDGLDVFANHTRRPHQNRTHRITRHPGGLIEASTQVLLNARNVAEPLEQTNSALPWIFVGILGTVVLALMTLLIVQNMKKQRMIKKRQLLTEKSPLLPSEEEQLY